MRANATQLLSPAIRTMLHSGMPPSPLALGGGVAAV